MRNIRAGSVILSALIFIFIAPPPLNTLLLVIWALVSAILIGRATWTPQRIVRFNTVIAAQRGRIVSGLLLISTLLLLLSTDFLTSPRNPYLIRFDGALWLYLSIGTLIAALLLAFYRLQGDFAALKPARRLALAIGLFYLLILSLTNGNADALWLFISQHVQMVLLIGGGALLAFVLLTEPNQPVVSDRRLMWRTEYWAVAGIVLLAFWLRILSLEYAVHIVVVDEGAFMNGAVRLRDEPFVRILIPFSGITAFTSLHSYLQMTAAELLTPTLVALRLPGVIFGTLNVVAVYFLGRMLFKGERLRHVALLAALFLALFPPHIHFSRYGINNIVDPFFGTMMLALLVRAYRRLSLRDAVLAGVMLGCTQYFYEGGRLLFPALAVLYTLPFWRQRVTRRFWLMAGLLALPLYYALIAFGYGIFPRANSGFQVNTVLTPEVNAQAVEIFLRARAVYFEHYVYALDTVPAHYGGSTPLLLPYMLPFFFAGLCWLLYHALHNHDLRIVALWLVGGTAGASLVVPLTITARLTPMFPSIALVTAIGAALVWDGFGRALLRVAGHRPPAHTQWLDMLNRSAFGILTISLSIACLVFYFGMHLPQFNLQHRPVPDYIDIAYRARSFPQTIPTVVITDEIFYMHHILEIMRYWNLQLNITQLGIDDFDPTGMARDQQYLFFIRDDDQFTLLRLRRQFPNNLYGPFYSPYNVPRQQQYAMYYTLAPTGEP